MLILIRLKIPFSSSLFFAIRVKKLQLTFSSWLNSFATNSNKVLIDFTHNFAHSGPGFLSVKVFPIFDHPCIILTLTYQSASKKTRRQNRASKPTMVKPSLFFVHNIHLFFFFFFFYKTLSFSLKISSVFKRMFERIY